MYTRRKSRGARCLESIFFYAPNENDLWRRLPSAFSLLFPLSEVISPPEEQEEPSNLRLSQLLRRPNSADRAEKVQCLFPLYPTWAFRNSKSFDLHFWTTYNSSINGFRGSKIVRRSVKAYFPRLSGIVKLLSLPYFSVFFISSATTTTYVVLYNYYDYIRLNFSQFSSFGRHTC